MKVRTLLPPLVASLILFAVLGTVMGGAPWLWLIAGWIGAAPLTLVWMRLGDMWADAADRAPRSQPRPIARRTDDR